MQSRCTPLPGLMRCEGSLIAAVFAGSAALLLLGATRTSHAEERVTHAAQHASADGHSADHVGIGRAGAAAEVTRTVRVTMLDTMRFTPAKITVRKGETLRFRIHNQGKVVHEWVLGTAQGLREHQKQMDYQPDMAHTDANTLSLQAGEQAERIWKFDTAGTVYFACLQPGHAAAGMRGQITVKAPASGDPHAGHSH